MFNTSDEANYFVMVLAWAACAFAISEIWIDHRRSARKKKKKAKHA